MKRFRLLEVRTEATSLNPTKRMTSLVERIQSDSLVRNSGYFMATTVVTSAVGYGYWLMAARLFSAADVGLAAALISAMLLASALSDLGVRTGLVQLLPRRSSSRSWSLTLTTALVTGAAAGAAAAVLVVAFLPVVSERFTLLRNPWASALLIAGVVGTTTSGVLDYAAVATRSSRAMFLRNLVAAVAKLIFLALPFVTTLGARGVLLSWVAPTVLSTALGFGLVRRVYPGYRPTFKGYSAEVKAIFRTITAHHAINLGNLAPLFFLPIMVALRVSSAQTAYFYTTWRVGTLFAMVSPAVSSSMFAEGANSTRAATALARSSLKLIGVLLVPAVVIFLLCGRPILSFLGPEYAHYGWPLLLVLLASAAPDAITNVYTSLLRVEGRLRLAAAMNLSMAAVCLGVAWALLPHVGIVGAGYAWLAAQLLGVVVIVVDKWMAGDRRRCNARVA